MRAERARCRRSAEPNAGRFLGSSADDRDEGAQSPGIGEVAMQRALKVALIFTALSIVPAVALAQQGQIAGTVRDDQGASCLASSWKSRARR